MRINCMNALTLMASMIGIDVTPDSLNASDLHWPNFFLFGPNGCEATAKLKKRGKRCKQRECAYVRVSTPGSKFL